MTRSIRYITTILFACLMLTKGISSMLPFVSNSLKILLATELVDEMDQEQEAKSSKVVEGNPAEELFDSMVSGLHVEEIDISIQKSVHATQPLPDVHLSTLTPPPNSALC